MRHQSSVGRYSFCYDLLLAVYLTFQPSSDAVTTQFLEMALPHIVAGGHAKAAEYLSNAIHVCNKALSSLPDVITSIRPGKALLVADDNTVKLLDADVLNSLDHYVIHGGYNASVELVDSVRRAAGDADLIVALGSGTINDICKYICRSDSKEYILFPTATSMNGYTSPNASITAENGIKKSCPGKLPLAIYVDTDILTKAPARLIKSGFADFICRSTVRADWLLSHALLGTPYDELPFLISAAVEQALVENYRGLIAQDSDTIMLLMQALFLSGIGMFVVGGSQSASQGEHILAGATELLDAYDFLHGERVGVATVIMARLQKKVCGMKPRLSATSLDQSVLRQHFNADCASEFCDTLSQKAVDSQKAAHLNRVIDEKWEYISKRVVEEVLDPELLEGILRDMGSPYLPEHVGWTTEKYRVISNLAFATRNRFTFLDIAHHAKVPVM
ncbi:MAG: iron-containing alcohol dehydrogenase [Anaplasma sp.]